jgi:hypothetical protein
MQNGPAIPTYGSYLSFAQMSPQDDFQTVFRFLFFCLLHQRNYRENVETANARFLLSGEGLPVISVGAA